MRYRDVRSLAVRLPSHGCVSFWTAIERLTGSKPMPSGASSGPRPLALMGETPPRDWRYLIALTPPRQRSLDRRQERTEAHGRRRPHKPRKSDSEGAKPPALHLYAGHRRLCKTSRSPRRSGSSRPPLLPAAASRTGGRSLCVAEPPPRPAARRIYPCCPNKVSGAISFASPGNS
jgi:hypothetical protein